MIPGLGWALLLLGSAFASTVHVESSLRPVPVTLAGTLEPASLSINGRLVSSRGERARALLLNGAPLKAEQSAIFIRTGLDRLELEWEFEDGTKRPAVALSYPAIVSFKVTPVRAQIQVNDQTLSLLIDSNEVALRDNRGEFVHASVPDWLERPHVIELQSSEGGSRIYELDPSFREEVLSEKKAALGIFSPPNGSAMGLMASYGRVWPNRTALSAGLGFSQQSYSSGPGSEEFSQKSMVLLVRGGLRPLKPGDGWIDFRRLEMGLSGEAFVDHGSFSTSASTASTNQTDGWTSLHAALGFYFQFEPVLIHGWGLSFVMSPRLIQALRPFDYGNMGGGIELAYHW